MRRQDRHISMNDLTTNNTSNSDKIILPRPIEFSPKRRTKSHQISRCSLIYNSARVKTAQIYKGGDFYVSGQYILLLRTVYFTFQDRIFYFSGQYILLFRTIYFTFQDPIFYFSGPYILLFKTVYFTFQDHIFYFSGPYILLSIANI